MMASPSKGAPRNIGKKKAALSVPARSQRKKEKARPDRLGIEMCRRCGAVFWAKAWRRSLDVLPNVPRNTKIVNTLCPACEQAKRRVFEGEVIVEDIPARFFGEIARRIEILGERSRSRDPVSRILTLEASRRDGRIRATVSENQLARLIARKLRESYGAGVSLKFSGREAVLRARVKFDEK